MILDGKYDPAREKLLFYSNRFLRIFPLYWLMLSLFILLTSIKYFFHIGSDDNAITLYLHNTSSMPLWVFIGSLVNFIMRNITLLLAVDYVVPINAYPGYLFVQQAWTLQIELLFYLLAPFIVRLSNKVFFVFCLMYLLVVFGVFIPFHFLASTLTILLLSDLLFFLLGIIGYRFIYKHLQEMNVPIFILYGIFICFILYLLLYNFIPIIFSFPFLQISDVFYFIVLVFSIPFIFLLTQKNRFDRMIGQLSYPIYITHFLIIKIFDNVHIFYINSNAKVIAIICLTLFTSIFIMRYFENPLDSYRHKHLKPLLNLSKR